VCTLHTGDGQNGAVQEHAREEVSEGMRRRVRAGSGRRLPPGACCARDRQQEGVGLPWCSVGPTGWTGPEVVDGGSELGLLRSPKALGFGDGARPAGKEKARMSRARGGKGQGACWAS
jgi:hypothetical protein